MADTLMSMVVEMNISYVGHSRLLPALQSLIDRLNIDSNINAFTDVGSNFNDNYDLLIADSQHFSAILSCNLLDIKTQILILGHYTDSCSQDAFCPNENLSYIPYCNIETELPRYLIKITDK